MRTAEIRAFLWDQAGFDFLAHFGCATVIHGTFNIDEWQFSVGDAGRVPT
jgi:hypothetical protein